MFGSVLEALEQLYYEIQGLRSTISSWQFDIFMPVYVLLGIWFMTWLLFKIFKD